MIKLKYIDIVEILNSKFFNKISTVEFELDISYKLKIISKCMMDEADIYNSLRDDIAQKNKDF